MTASGRKRYEYTTDRANELTGVLAIRIVVGLPLAAVAAFFGSIFNGVLVPSPVAGSELAFITRITIVGVAASSGGMIAWFNLFESKSGGALVWVVGCIGGVTGAAVAYFIGKGLIDHPDVYIFGQHLSRVVLLGAAVGSNFFITILSLTEARFGK